MSMKRSNNGGNSIEEPSTAPQPNRWYTLTLGPSFKDRQPSPKFCTLRYGFKPASIDRSQPGTLHKDKDNRVTVEFHNNQLGKPRVAFEGVMSDDYKENDAVLIFDGDTFRLERLHRAVKRLRLLEPPSTGQAGAGIGGDGSSPPVGKAVKGFNLNKSEVNHVVAEVERIDFGVFGSFGNKTTEIADVPPAPPNPMASPNPRNDDLDEVLDIMNDDDDDDGYGISGKDNEVDKAFHSGIDINVPHQMDPDDEILDVDGNTEDNVGVARDPEDAHGVKVIEQGREGQTSSSSGSSGSETTESSDSGSSSSGSSSSSDGEGSDDEPIDID